MAIPKRHHLPENELYFLWNAAFVVMIIVGRQKKSQHHSNKNVPSLKTCTDDDASYSDLVEDTHSGGL